MPLTTEYLRGRSPVSPLVNPATGSGQFERDDLVAMTCQPVQIVTKFWVDASTIVTNGIVTSHAGAGAAGTTIKTPNGSLATAGIATLTPARNVVITVTHGSAVVAMSGTITGTRMGRTITEAWSVTAGTTSKTFTGAIAFDTVISITEVVAANASANTIIVGNGKVLGLDFKCASVKVIADEQDGALPTLGVLVKASTAATADPRGTYTPNATLNGALHFQVWYLASDLTAIY